MPDIFISYAREDIALAKTLSEKLSAHGWDIWWDRHIVAGNFFYHVIEENLEASKCVIVLWTPSSRVSGYVIDEANEALERRKLVPIQVGNTRPPMGFRTIQSIIWDGSGEIEEEELNELLLQLKSILGEPELKNVSPTKKIKTQAANEKKPKTDRKISKAAPQAYNTEQQAHHKVEVKRSVTDIQELEKQALDFYNRALANHEKGAYDEAIIDFNQAVELNPNDIRFYLDRGNAYFYKKSYEEALTNYEKAISLNPNYDLAYYNRGIIYYNLRDYNKALQEFSKTIELNPKYGDAYNYAGMVHDELNNDDEAINNYKKAIDINPYNAYPWNNCGKILLDKKEYQQALGYFDKAIILKQDGIFYNNRGLCKIQLSDLNGACKDFKRAAELGNAGGEINLKNYCGSVNLTESSTEPIGTDSGFTSNLKRILEEYKNLFGKKYFVTPDIPEKKLMNARQSCRIPVTEQVLAMFDCTIFGSGDDCIVITPFNIYHHALWEEPFSIPFQNLNNANPVKKVSVYKVSFDNKELNFVGSDVNLDKAVEMLEKIKWLVLKG